MRPAGYHLRIRDLVIRPSWWREARCTGQMASADFFPSDGNYQAAKALCLACRVRVDCLAYGLEEYDGVWGGLCRSERRQLRRLQQRLRNRYDDPLNAHDVAILITAGMDKQQLQVICGLAPDESANLLARGIAVADAASRLARTLPERVANGDPTIEHGRMGTYNAGCRCDPCRQARRNDMRARREQQKRANHAA